MQKQRSGVHRLSSHVSKVKIPARKYLAPVTYGYNRNRSSEIISEAETVRNTLGKGGKFRREIPSLNYFVYI